MWNIVIKTDARQDSVIRMASGLLKNYNCEWSSVYTQQVPSDVTQQSRYEDQNNLFYAKKSETRVPSVSHTTIWFPARAFPASNCVWPHGSRPGPSDRSQWNFSQHTSRGTVYFLRGAALFSPRMIEWSVRAVCACMHAFSQSSPFIHSALISLWDISALWSILYSSPLIDCIMANGAAVKVWPVRHEEFMVPWVLFVFKDVLFLCLCD